MTRTKSGRVCDLIDGLGSDTEGSGTRDTSARMIELVRPYLPLYLVAVALCLVGVLGLKNKASAKPSPRLGAARLSLSVAAPNAGESIRSS